LKKLAPLVLIALLVPLANLVARQSAGDAATKEKLTAMLRQFLVDAARGNVAGFESFFCG